MKLIKLSMGCLSSRSSVSPSDREVEANGRVKNRESPAQPRANGNLASSDNNNKNNQRDDHSSRQQANMIDRGGIDSSYMNGATTRGVSLEKKSISHDNSLGSSIETADDDIVSLLMEDKGGGGDGGGTGHKNKQIRSSEDGRQQQPLDRKNNTSINRRRHFNTSSLNGDEDVGSAADDDEEEGNTSMPSKRNEGSFDVSYRTSEHLIQCPTQIGAITNLSHLHPSLLPLHATQTCRKNQTWTCSASMWQSTMK